MANILNFNSFMLKVAIARIEIVKQHIDYDADYLIWLNNSKGKKFALTFMVEDLLIKKDFELYQLYTEKMVQYNEDESKGI